MITSFKPNEQAGGMALRLLAVAAWMVLGLALALLPLRAEPISVGFDAAHIDLFPLVQKVAEISPTATLELPATGAAPAHTVALNARGAGPYRWAVFTLHNPAAQARHMVVAAPHQRFVASQVLWPRPEGSRVIGLVSADGQAVAPLPSLGVDAFGLTLPPGATASYALEVSTTGLDTLSLWHRGAFHVVADRYAFFRGMVLGISILLGISFVCLFIVRPQSIFPAAALFGWSAIAFLVIEMGYLPTVVARLPALAGSEQSLRALAEGLMLAGVIAMLASFLDLRRWMPRLATGLMACGAAAVALVLFGLFDPRIAIGLIRIAFALVVAGGLGVMLVLWRRGAARAQAALLGWLVLIGWTVAAGAGALGLFEPALMHPLVSAGLVLVLLTIAFTLAQLAFGLGLGAASGAGFEEGGRRALALAASDQAVWDWQADQGNLHVGPEIERALGLNAGTLGEDAASWLELLHPADRAAYGAAVEAAERRGRGSFSQEFRLRRTDGSYRWYELRARALPGVNGGASRLIGTLADVTAIRRSEDRLLADAVRDRLTGLPNRALFLDRLEQAIGRTRDWADAELYVIALDLDRFKSFNDGLGVEAGDYLLQTTGRRLQACLGPADTVARLPGHQFGVLWDASRHAFGIAELVGAISASVSQPIQLTAGEVVLTASMGVALVHGEYRGAETVLKDAEIALYEAKRQGYGAVEYFRSDMHDERSQLLQLEQNLRHALERNEIEVVYQPIVRLADRKLAGFEALMRWRRGDSVLEPDSFMGLAEETGLIRELGRHVLKEAVSRLGTWQRAFRRHDPLFVAVNISSVQLLNNDLVEDIGRLMEREDLKPGTLKLELTESLVVENLELARKLLVRLKQMGVALACDDFGTGYSGLESVLRLPFDSVKLDRVFLEAETGERNWDMVEAMLRLARDLGLDVVAEGIETDEQMERLSRLGCDYGQGYLIGPPVMAQQVIAALGGHSQEAAGLGTGLAAFWNRLTGAGEAEADRAVTQAPLKPEAGSEPFKDPDVREEIEDEPVIDIRGDVEDEPVIDVRGIMAPAPKPPAPKPPASKLHAPKLHAPKPHAPKPHAPKPPAPNVPAVGSAPFAPRRVRPPEVEWAEISLSEFTWPTVVTEEAPGDDPGPVEPGSVEPGSVELNPVEATPPPEPDRLEPSSEAKRGKRKRPKADHATEPNARNGRRGSKTAPGKAGIRSAAAKTQAKKASAQSLAKSPAESLATSESAKSASAKSASVESPAKIASAKAAKGARKAGPAKRPGKSAPARRGPAKPRPARQR